MNWCFVSLKHSLIWGRCPISLQDALLNNAAPYLLDKPGETGGVQLRQIGVKALSREGAQRQVQVRALVYYLDRSDGAAAQFVAGASPEFVVGQNRIVGKPVSELAIFFKKFDRPWLLADVDEPAPLLLCF